MQGHDYTEGRPIVAETAFKESVKNPEAGKWHKHESLFLLAWREYKGNKWGMVIDQTACIGCNTCMAACSSENDLPVIRHRSSLRP